LKGDCSDEQAWDSIAARPGALMTYAPSKRERVCVLMDPRGCVAAGNEPPSEQYVGLVSRCWSQSSAGRPSFEEIAVELERMYKKLKREQRKP
jgi:hypothetical protein